jgi:hypothetical protein
MDEKKEKDQKMPEGKIGRRSFFAKIYKNLLGFSAFTIASLFGLKRDGEIRLGKMKNTGVGFSEAYGKCGSSFNCSGGGGECGSSFNCGGGGGECGSSFNCSGGGGECGSSFNCSGGGGECGSSFNCSGE